jgi:hypothetical protein
LDPIYITWAVSLLSIHNVLESSESKVQLDLCYEELLKWLKMTLIVYLAIVSNMRENLGP